MNRARVLVLGGTGHYGRCIVDALVNNQQIVRVLSRNPATARQLLPARVECVPGDILNADSVATALKNVDSVVVAISAFTPRLIRQLKAIEQDGVLGLLDLMVRQGVTRLVYLSVYDIRWDVLSELGITMETARVKQAVEDALAASSLNWTVFGAPPAFDLFLRTWRGNKLMAPGGGPPAIPSIAKEDVGIILAQAAVRHDLDHQRFRLAGPEVLSFPRAAEALSAVCGESVRVVPIPLGILKAAAFLSRPFFPYLHHLVESVTLMKHFPADLVEQIPADHTHLLNTFDFSPTSFGRAAEVYFRGMGD